MTAAETGLEVVELPAFDPPCEYVGHEIDAPTCWIYLMMNPRSCGCSRGSTIFVCALCHEFITTTTNIGVCTTCGGVLPTVGADIIKMEKFR